MKKKIILAISIAVSVLLIAVISLVLLDAKYNLRHFFDKWESEVETDYVHVYNEDYLYIDSESFSLSEVLQDGALEEVYCIKNDRIYFCYSTVSESYPHQIWHIASVNLKGEELTVHFSKEATDTQKSAPTEYHPLAYCSDREGLDGGLYEDGKIFFYTNGEIFAYDIDRNIAGLTQESPSVSYRWEVKDHQNIVFEDVQNGRTYTVTPEELAKNNSYAQKLTELSSRKDWDGLSLTEDFFVRVKAQGDHALLITQVRNWLGESFAVVFQYDFASQEVRYVSYFKTGDTAAHYSPIEMS